MSLKKDVAELKTVAGELEALREEVKPLKSEVKDLRAFVSRFVKLVKSGTSLEGIASVIDSFESVAPEAALEVKPAVKKREKQVKLYNQSDHRKVVVR